MNNTINNYSLTVDEDQVLLEMFEFFDDVGLPDNIDPEAYDTLQKKFFNNVN